MPTASSAPFEIFIWGPAFDLPSIDAECNAIVGVFSSIPDLNWRLYAHYNPALVKAGGQTASGFPCLRHGLTLVSGFTGICRYMMNTGLIPASMEPPESGVATAITSLLDSKARQLVDLYLCVTDKNWEATTRPAYTAILPTYVNYLYPTEVKSAAEVRTQSCGVRSLSRSFFFNSDHIPSLSNPFDAFRKHQQHAHVQSKATTSSRPALASTTESDSTSKPAPAKSSQAPVAGVLATLKADRRHVDGPRLEQLASQVFVPLCNVLADKPFLFSSLSSSSPTSPARSEKHDSSSSPTFIDFLAFGYLALILFPQTPDPWLADILTAEFPQLVKYTESLKRKVLHHERRVLLLDAFDPAAALQKRGKLVGPSPLPWALNPCELPSLESADSVSKQEKDVVGKNREKGPNKFSHSAHNSASGTRSRTVSLINAVFSALRDPAVYFSCAFLPKVCLRITSESDELSQSTSLASASSPSKSPSKPSSFPISLSLLQPLSPTSLFTFSLLAPTTGAILLAGYLLISHHFSLSRSNLSPSAPDFFVFYNKASSQFPTLYGGGGLLSSLSRR